MLRKSIRRLGRYLGYNVVFIKDDLQSLGDLIRANVHTVIDVGVGPGTPWLYSSFPNAFLFLIDPVDEIQPIIIKALEGRLGGYQIVAVGDGPGEADINVENSDVGKSSLLARTALTTTQRSIDKRRTPVDTIDNIVRNHGLIGPFGIKIDTEGYEVKAIRGARKTLVETAFVIAEASIRPRFIGSYTFEELMDELFRAGFSVSRLLSVNVGRDGAVNSVDIMFTPRRDAE